MIKLYKYYENGVHFIEFGKFKYGIEDYKDVVSLEEHFKYYTIKTSYHLLFALFRFFSENTFLTYNFEVVTPIEDISRIEDLTFNTPLQVGKDIAILQYLITCEELEW